MDRLRALTADSVPLALVPAFLVLALGLDQGGFSPNAWVWAAALPAWAAALALSLGGSLAAPRIALLWLAAAGALLAWTAASLLWSSRQTQSLLEARRMLVYVAAVLVLALPARRAAGRTLVGWTHGAITALVVYALARYLFGGRHLDPFEGALLSQPLGYANALGILAALGIVLAVGMQAGAGQSRTRAGAAASTPVLALALTLTHSRASWLALGAGVLIAALLEREHRRILRAAAVAAAPAVVVSLLGAASHLSDAARRPWPHAGWILAAAAVACGTLAAAGEGRVSRSWPAAGLRARRAALAVVLAVVAAGAAAVVRTGSTEPRASLWHVAWRDFVAHPLLGSGAGTFAAAWARSGLEGLRGGALDAHSLYLETLAELGLVGLLLLAALVLLPLVRVAAARTPYGAAAAGAYVAFLLHAGLDWDWEMPAVVVAGLACGAATLLASDPPRTDLPQRARTVALAAAVALGLGAIAGARSQAEPGVAPQRGKAPAGAFHDARAGSLRDA